MQVAGAIPSRTFCCCTVQGQFLHELFAAAPCRGNSFTNFLLLHGAGAIPSRTFCCCTVQGQFLHELFAAARCRGNSFTNFLLIQFLFNLSFLTERINGLKIPKILGTSFICFEKSTKAYKQNVLKVGYF
jgi:hypothetical protein